MLFGLPYLDTIFAKSVAAKKKSNMYCIVYESLFNQTSWNDVLPTGDGSNEVYFAANGALQLIVQEILQVS